MTENSIVIQINNCTTSYDKEEVLRDVSLTVRERDFTVIIGSSGCGKTTLLKTINGLVVPLRGEITVNGYSLANCDMTALRQEIGYVVQGARLFPHMSVLDNICYVPSLSKKLSKEEKLLLADNMLSLVRLSPELSARFPKQLSGGQQQRVGIARALASHPKILLMDEPFGAIDEITRRELLEELIELQEKTGITIVFITHDIREAVKLGKKIVVMKEGRILQEGSADELIKNPCEKFVAQLFENIGGYHS